MGLFDRMEGRLERAVNGLFARAFRAEVQPVEIASAIRGAMDDRASRVAKGRSVVPNIFTIELSETDYERLSGQVRVVEDELVTAAEEHADSQRYQAGGPVRILLEEDTDLETGVFRVRPSTASRPSATGTTGQNATVRATPPSEPAEAAGPDRTAGPGRTAGPDGTPGLPAGRADPHASSGDPQGEDLQPTARHEPVPAPPAPRRVNPADRPWLDVDGDRYPLMGALTVLGRDDSADIVLDDPGISRRHCEIRVTNDGRHLVASIRDLGSTNGTYVNGERVSTEHVRDGDRVTVGRTTVAYRAGRR